MKIDELLRNAPANIHDLHLALADLPNNVKVKAHPETGVSEKTVDELRARTTWPAGLVGNDATQTQTKISGQDN
ncbi:MAG: hypothetical protein WA778_05275 [Pseudolabrys sp.]